MTLILDITQMTSIWHALRIIQCFDISQHDWHAGQILCNRPHSSSPPQAHAVLIDFSSTTQTLDLDIDLSKDDYGQCISAITHKDITGLDAKWVCEYWDREEMKRECWDTHRVALGRDGSRARWILTSLCMSGWSRSEWLLHLRFTRNGSSCCRATGGCRIS